MPTKCGQISPVRLMSAFGYKRILGFSPKRAKIVKSSSNGSTALMWTPRQAHEVDLCFFGQGVEVLMVFILCSTYQQQW